MNIRPLCYLALAVLGAAACGGAAPQARQATMLLERGEYREAELSADKALAEHPEIAELWRVKIQAAMGQRDAERAVAIYGQWHAKTGRHDSAALRRMAASTLWQGLRVPSAAVRAQTVQVIERLELERLAEDVVARMGDEDDIVVAAAAVALLRSHPAAPHLATRMLASEDAVARSIAVEGIGRKAGAMAHADLVPLLADPSPSVRMAAIRAVAAMNRAADTARLAQMARSDKDGAVRAQALGALGRRAGGLEAARQALGDEHPGVRLAAVQILARSGELGLLAEIARSDDLMAGLRAAVAVRARGRDHGGGGSYPALERALAHPDWTVRAAALNALAELVPREAAQATAQRMLADASDDVRMAAARALLRLGLREQAMGALLAGLGSSTPWARLQAATDLARLGDPRGAEALATLARDPEPSLREATMRARRAIGQVSDGLIAGLADELPSVRVLAAEIVLELVD